MKDSSGKDFELGLDARIDTSRWLTIRGIVKHARGCCCSTPSPAACRSPGRPPRPPPRRQPIRVPVGPPPEVIFSAPTREETDVPTGTTVRIQLSRDVDQSTLKGKIRVRYLEAQSSDRRAGHAGPRLHHAIHRREPRRGAPLREAARALPHGEGRSPLEGHSRHRRAAAQAVDAHVLDQADRSYWTTRKAASVLLLPAAISIT